MGNEAFAGVFSSKAEEGIIPPMLRRRRSIHFEEVRVQSISRVWFKSVESYPPKHLTRRDRHQIRYNAQTWHEIVKTRLTRLRFQVNSVDSVRLQKKFQTFSFSFPSQ